MKIEQNRIDDLNLELTLAVTSEDYAESRKKKLNDYRKKAEIKGFRKGMVPMSLIEKMYGQSALADSVNDVISSGLNNFISENNLRVLGEPLPAENQPETDWTVGNDFTFKFDMALNPEISFELSKEDEVTYYTITVTEAAKKEMKDNLLKQYGSLEEGEQAKEEDFIIVDFEQGDMKVEGTYVALRNVAEAARASFVGVKAGDVLIAIEGEPVKKGSSVQEKINRYRPGDKVSLVVLRKGKEHKLEATLIGKDAQDMGTVASQEKINLFGAELVPAPKNLLEKLGLKSGVQVSSIEKGKMKEAGIKQDFIITFVNNSMVTNPADVAAIVKKAKRSVLVEGVYPDGSVFYYAIGL